MDMEKETPKKKNIAVILAFVIPLLFIGIVVGVVYVSSMTLSTEYNFVYATCGDTNKYPYYRYCDDYLRNLYAVENGKLTEKEVNPNLDSDGDKIPDVDENYKTRLFFHDTGMNESREITIEEAKSLNLNTLITSPDGVSVTSDYDRGAEFFIFFDTGSSYGYYLTKGNKKRSLNLINSGDSYYNRYNFRFVGWITE